MPIRTFASFVSNSELEPSELRDCPLVVDATNFFYDSYKDTDLPYQTGAEADLYAAKLREQLEVFRRAKVDCYFIFKGGHEDIQRKIQKVDRMRDEPPEIRPIFMKEICFEIVQEMGFKSGVCEFESKSSCVLLAQRLKCPILSYDIEFCFQPQPYIPSTTLVLVGDVLHCRQFTRANFLRKYCLGESQLAVFRALTDERYFPFEFFHTFMERNKIPTAAYKRFLPLFTWLSKNSDAEKLVVKSLTDEDKKDFEKAVASALVLPGNTTAVGWLLGERALPQFGHPEWMAASIFTMRVSGNLVNMVRSGVLHGDWMSVECSPPYDALAPCLDTLQFMLDLLKGPDNDGFVFRTHGEEKVLKRVVPVPEAGLAEGNTGIFEYWAQTRLQLSSNSLLRLEQLPRDAGLVVISLLLCAHAAPGWTRTVAYASLLRHVLGAREYAANEQIDYTDRQQHQLATAQHALQQVAVLRRLCAGARKRWLDAGRATNAARALALFEKRGDPREQVSCGLNDEPALLKEFNLLADAYEDMEPAAELDTEE